MLGTVALALLVGLNAGGVFFAAVAGVRMGPGTLYGALARLERHGLIEPLPATDRRRPYRLTAPGTALLGERLATLENFTAVGMRRLATA